ncbi:hypothetical protein Esi_0033_0127 [Ectocarpus siliculosus]|uniref:Uncharacterized protein n=1 Tax=Ectocarpus siliculosus TaxID=2880 RepID=D7FXN3_ECTSI|nr:hypothetical protein Esi_0033_0127 [Ectocarpus siliculosus]|eukprot:CBJ26474.1 hypothetical protein Esi_0033_0127 [Ectocarpus siliculosus]
MVMSSSRVVSLNSSVASTASRVRKRRPSVLGGGFSTAGSCASSSPKSIQGSWIEDDTDPKAGPCWQQRDAGRVGHPAIRRGSRSDGHDDDDDDDRDEEEEEDHDNNTESTEITVVGWGDRSSRRNSSRRASREETAEWNDGRPRRLSSKGVVLATATATANSQQRQQQQYDGTANETHQVEAGVRNKDKTLGGAATSIGTAIAYVGSGSDDGSGVSISVERATEIATIPTITPPPFQGGQQAAAAAATSIPSVAQPSPAGETPEIGTQSPASQSAGEGASAKSGMTPTRMGLAASAPNLPTLGSMNNESDQHSSRSGSRFPQVLPRQRWCQEGRGASVRHRAGLAVAAGGGLGGCGVLPDGGGQKVFHNFVFRRNKRRKDRKPLRATLASLDDNATDYQAAYSAGGTRGRRAAGWRPERPGQMNRTCPPPRTPSDAFSVVSFSSSGSALSPRSSPPANGQRAGGGTCSSGVGRRPVKCQRCGSGRVKLFATTVVSARRSPTHLLRQPPRGASSDSYCARAGHTRENAGGGGSRNGGTPSYSVAGSGSSTSCTDRLRLAPVSNRHTQRGNARKVTSMLSPRRKNLAGLSDTGRISTGGVSLAELRGGERNAANRPRGLMDGAAVVGSRKASVRPPPGGGIIIPAPKPHLRTPVSSGGSGL